jgi:hypothetical protein
MGYIFTLKQPCQIIQEEFHSGAPLTQNVWMNRFGLWVKYVVISSREVLSVLLNEYRDVRTLVRVRRMLVATFLQTCLHQSQLRNCRMN